ncbi:MAG: hypothetical protein HND47_08295 [Chloroflexi bacterium]|nr:hypothetical protein [Chloroflexota bacterium]
MFAEEPQPIVVEIKTPEIEVVVVDSDVKLKDLAGELGRAKVISFDTETTDTEEMKAELVGISLAVKEGRGYYIPIGHRAGNNLPLAKVIEALRAVHDEPEDWQDGAQCQIRLHRARAARAGRFAAHVRYDAGGIYRGPILAQYGLEESRRGAPGRRDDSHRGTDRQGQEANQHGGCGHRERRQLRRRRRRNHTAPHAHHGEGTQARERRKNPRRH